MNLEPLTTENRSRLDNLLDQLDDLPRYDHEAIVRLGGEGKINPLSDPAYSQARAVVAEIEGIMGDLKIPMHWPRSVCISQIPYPSPPTTLTDTYKGDLVPYYVAELLWAQLRGKEFTLPDAVDPDDEQLPSDPFERRYRLAMTGWRPIAELAVDIVAALPDDFSCSEAMSVAWSIRYAHQGSALNGAGLSHVEFWEAVAVAVRASLTEIDWDRVRTQLRAPSDRLRESVDAIVVHHCGGKQS